MARPLSRRELLRQLAAVAVSPALLQRSRMLTRPIPSTGEQLPVIGLGTWQTFDAAASELDPLRDVLRRFNQLGGRVIDSSPMYGRAEEVVGRLAADLALQDKAFFATKVWTSGKGEGVRQMNESMSRMRVRRMDLMQVHNLVDVETHLATLNEWKRAARIRYIGITHYQTSAFPALQKLLERGQIDFVQFNYSLHTRHAEQRLLPACAANRVAVMINRPFESGEMFERVRGKPLPAWAADIDCASWGQIFLKYIVSHPAVTCVIPATANPRHLEDNMAAGGGRFPDSGLRSKMAAAYDALR